MRGNVGTGIGFPAALVNVSDSDNDGVVCELAPPTPTPDPTPAPTPEPTREPTPDPTPEPTPEPTPDPTPEPTPDPTPEPTPVVTDRPVPTPLAPGPAVSPPPFPNTFQGSVTIDGEPAEDGIEIYAEIVEGTAVYATFSVLVADGRYSLLQVGPPSTLFHNDTINFYAWIDGAGVQSAETSQFDANISPADLGTQMVLDLTFTTSGS